MALIKCTHCGNDKRTYSTSANLFCSRQCANDFQYKQRVAEWKLSGESTRVSGTPGWLRRYFFEKQNGKCAGCLNDTWRNQPITLELEHKDGNSDHNKEENLELLCPNCHSQSSTYKAKNKGNGRHYRRQLYKEGKSF